MGEIDTQRPRLPVIRCAVCNKLVDRVSVIASFEMDTTHIRVMCHGAFDEMKLTGEDIMGMTGDELAQIVNGVGVAFQRKALA